MMNIVKRAKTKLWDRLSPHGLILMYHRVAEPELDPWGLSVSPRHFAEQLEVINRYFHPLSMQELLKRLQAGRVPNRFVVVTFDDGYVDNLHAASPLLQRFHVPATVFLIAESLGAERNFWWDELEWVLLHPETLPDRLELDGAGNHWEWDLGEATRYSPEDRQGDRNRRPWDALAGTRLAFFYSVWRQLRELPGPARLQALDAIGVWSGAGKDCRPDARALTPEEVNRLDRSGVVELGSHTLTHPSLILLSAEQQMGEIHGSKIQVEEIIGRPITSFSYPHGDYSLETAALVQKAGFSSACTTEASGVLSTTDPFLLPRFQVDNWDGEEFLRHLARWYAFA
ncbi:MAG TPA: polysaccharide deacetylase family protein [Anaerolineales bacterium]|nr:polysaccharide deacetylase family protein [Anaerolineales bacterium]